MKFNQFFSILLCLLLSTSIFAQRDTIDFNKDWQFAVDKKAEGQSNKWFEKSLANTKTVQLPHTWNIEKENDMHYGWGWYQKKFNIPANWKNKNVVLQFGAINHTSFIYVNGKKVEENIGDGYSKFYINLNGKLNYGKENNKYSHTFLIESENNFPTASGLASSSYAYAAIALCLGDIF